MMKRRLTILFIAAVVGCLPGFPGSARTQETQSGEPWQAQVLSQERLAAALENIKKTLAKSPVAAPENDADAKLRVVLEGRAERLEELIGLVAALEHLIRETTSLPEKRTQLEAKMRTLGKSDMPRGPVDPTVEQVERLKGQLESHRKDLVAITNEINERAESAGKATKRFDNYENRRMAAQQRITELSVALDREKDNEVAKVLKLRLGNEEIESRIAGEGIRVLEAEESFEKQAASYRNLALESAQKALAATEEEYELYLKALARNLTIRQAVEEQTLAQKKQATERATTPEERFLASWEAQAAEARAGVARLDGVKATLERLETEISKRLQAEKNELKNLRSLVKETGATGYTAERLKRTVQRIEGREKSLRSSDREQLSTDLNRYLDQRFEIDDKLFALNEKWREDLDAVSASVPESGRSAFEAKAAEVRENLRRALLEERTKLTAVSNLGQELLRLANSRKVTFEELQTFLLTQLVYIRDAQPLGVRVLENIPGEMRTLESRGGAILASKETRDFLQQWQRAEGMLASVLVFVLLPGVLLYVRLHLRRFVRAQNEASRDDNSMKRKVTTTAVAVVGTLLLPAYLVALALFMQISAGPDDVRLLFRNVLLHVALFLFLWLQVRAFVGRGAIAKAQFGLRADTAATLQRCLHLGLLAYLFLLTPWVLLREPPFGLDALPRLLYTLFEVLVAVAVILLVRQSSPLVRDLNGAPTSEKPSLVWRLVFVVSLVVPGIVLVMDVLGYRYGASYLAMNAILSLLTGLILAGAYRIILPLAERLMRSRKLDLTAAPGEDVTVEAWQFEVQTRKFLRALFFLIGLVALAFYWEIDRGLLKAMDTISLYDIRSGNAIVESISVRDLLQAIVVLFLAGWILKNLPGIYELTFFSHYHWDPGIRYAFLTMSRYGVLFVGILIAMSSVHLDLSRIGLVMAALGVGLGFGLQEIVSNFVSGLILLVERPVRVNDIISVGQMSGEVKRINIRATTIVNWDRQEVIIPNKDFITKEVTNWTLADKTLRLVVPIGVAYGSDVDQVRSILLDVALRQPEVLRDPAPQALFLNHGDSALEFELRAFVPQPRFRFQVTDRLNSEINKEFAAHGITIPFPQRDLHIRTPESSEVPSVLCQAMATDHDTTTKTSTDRHEKATED